VGFVSYDHMMLRTHLCTTGGACVVGPYLSELMPKTGYLTPMHEVPLAKSYPKVLNPKS